MSNEISADESQERAVGFVPGPTANEIQGDQISQSSAEDWLKKEQHSAAQFSQKYARPYINVGQSSVDDVANTMYKTINIYAPNAVHSDVTVDQAAEMELRRIRATYVHPRPYQRALNILNTRRVLVLWGEAAYGKATTAVRLLLETYPTVFRLDPTTDIDRLRDHEFYADQGYIIDTYSAESAQQLKSFLLGRLSNTLQNQQSALVITIDAKVQIDRAEVSDYVLQWRERPAYDKLLEQHVTWLNPTFDEYSLQELRQLIAEPQVQEFLHSNPRIGDVCELAALLKRVLDNDLAFDQAIQQVAFFADNEVQEWFAKPLHTLRERSLMITLAVFNGATQDIVNMADDKLYHLLEPPSDPEQPHVAPSFFESVRERFRAVCASQKRFAEKTQFGMTDTTVIEFDNPALQRAVLDHIWNEYPRLHTPLIQWLGQLGCHENEEVQGRAAAAVGWLARFDFKAMLNELITPWAADERWQPHAAAALALGVLAYDDTLAPNIIELLRSWCRAKSPRALKLTAILAYGSLVGERFPNIALQRLCLLTQVQRADPIILDEVMYSVVRLFLARQHEVEHVRKVLESLVLWTEAPGYTIAIWTGLLIFLRLAEVARIEAKPGEGHWPTLLWLLMEDEESAKRITTLWQRALANRLTSRQALRNILRRWVRIVDNDTRLEPAFERLVVALADTGDENDRERIVAFLENRVDDPKDQSRIAARLLTRI